MLTGAAADALAGIVVRGRELKADVAEAVTKAHVDMSTSEVGQLTLNIVDVPGLPLLASRLLDAGAAVDYLELRHRTAVVEPDLGPGGHLLAVTARSLLGLKLKDAVGELTLRNLSPTQAMAQRVAAAGGRFVGEPSPGRPQVVRKADESDWDLGQRLAKEVGFLAGDDGAGTYYFGRPSWLIDRPGEPELRVIWGLGARPDEADAITCRPRRSEQAVDAATLDLTLDQENGRRVRPFWRLVLRGVPTFDGRYLVTSVAWDVDGVSPVGITATTPLDPAPEPPSEDTPDKAGGAGPDAEAADLGAAKSATEFVRIAQAQAGDTYRFGAEASSGDADPDAFDCSELVEWAAGRVGVKVPDGSGNQRAHCRKGGGAITIDEAKRTRGALLWHPGHVAISLGNGRTIEARGRRYGVCEADVGGRFSEAYKIPGMRY